MKWTAVQPEDVLSYWFGDGPSADETALRGKMKRWFLGGPAEDASIRERFGAAVDAALAGELDGWATTPRGRLALVLLLDQMTRSAFRGSARAFAGDDRALALALEALDQGIDAAYDFEGRQFLLMPLLHAESLAALTRLGPEMQRHIDTAPDFARGTLSAGMEQTVKYREVIERFGRFPHRNAALGRTSTPEEEAFLTEFAARAKPKLAREIDLVRGSSPIGLEVPQALAAELVAAYGEKHRAYHDVTHLSEVLDLYVDAARDAAWSRPREVYTALLFHDAVYTPGATDNEARSADWAARACEGPLAPFGIDAARVSELILLTARHGSIDASSLDEDAARFLDCDMAILGADPDRFDAYDDAIKREYAAIPAEAFAAGRRRFLEKLAASDSIYLSDWGKRRFEARARANLARALERARS